jgi:hypothetical protein
MRVRTRIFAIAIRRSRIFSIKQVHHFVVANMNIYDSLRVLIMKTGRWLALVSSLILVVISLAIMVVERTITAEAWAMLLLAPIPAGFAVTTRNGRNNRTSEIVDWQEEHDLEQNKSVGDPTEAGFDVPVL